MTCCTAWLRALAHWSKAMGRAWGPRGGGEPAGVIVVECFSVAGLQQPAVVFPADDDGLHDIVRFRISADVWEVEVSIQLCIQWSALSAWLRALAH
jgi:hypothetical protein